VILDFDKINLVLRGKDQVLSILEPTRPCAVSNFYQFPVSSGLRDEVHTLFVVSEVDAKGDARMAGAEGCAQQLCSLLISVNKGKFHEIEDKFFLVCFPTMNSNVLSTIFPVGFGVVLIVIVALGY
jgi:hypothetical protein